MIAMTHIRISARRREQSVFWKPDVMCGASQQAQDATSSARRRAGRRARGVYRAADVSLNNFAQWTGTHIDAVTTLLAVSYSSALPS